MGKASRIKNAKAAVAEQKKAQLEMKAKAEKRKRLITIISSSVIAGISVILVGALIFINAATANGTLLRGKNALKTDNFKVNMATFTYFLNYQYQNFVSSNSNYLTSYGLDPEVSIKDQQMANDQSWFDYMAKQTETNLEEVLYLCEKAKADGLKLEEEDQKEIEAFFDDMKEAAKELDMDLKEYISTAYGTGIKEEDIRAGLELSVLSNKWYNKNIGSLEFTDDQINEFYEENKNDFRTVDYRYYNVEFDVAKAEDVGAADELKAEAKKDADKLASAKTPEEFDTLLKAQLKKEGTTDEETIETALESAKLTNKTYDEDFEVSKWAFNEAKLYETYVYKTDVSYGVYMITKLPVRDESETRSVRHILLTKDTYKTDDGAKAKAEELLKKFNEGDKSAESFGKLAEEFTEDTGSASTGGLYENFKKGEMVEEFEDWSFDSSRKEGDTGIVKTTYGYHIMYFVKEGNQVWKDNVITAIKDDKYQTAFEDMKKTFKLTKYPDNYEDAPVITLRTNSAS